MMRGFFRGKRVLVTGDTGFKGSWLTFWLAHLGAEVKGFALPPSGASSHFESLGLRKLMTHEDGDLRDPEHFANVCRSFQPEILFHLAAQALVRKSYLDPKATFDTNVMGSVNVLEAVRLTESLRSVIYVTSDKCYKNKEWVFGYRENDELGGHDPYSASKAAAEIVYGAYQASYFESRDALGVASVRAGNVIGGGDWAEDRIVPDCIRAIRAGEPIIVRNPVATRPWQHVLEPVAAYMELARRLWDEPKRFRGAWNFGPEGTAIRTVRELADFVVEQWGSGQVVTPGPSGPHEAKLLHLSCDKAHHLLSWRPRWNFEQTLTRTVAWYQEVHGGKPAAQVTLGQIEDYISTRPGGGYRD